MLDYPRTSLRGSWRDGIELVGWLVGDGVVGMDGCIYGWMSD